MSEQAFSPKSNNFEVILKSAIDMPGIRINRIEFLKKELSKYFDDDVVNKAIEKNPAQAGLSVKNIEHIAKSCIIFETRKVSALSATAGLPGGLAMFATVPADTVQFFAHIIRILQKLAYLYGWQEMFNRDDNSVDDETANELILFIGVMFGVNAANGSLAKIAALAAQNVPKQLMQKALTKGTIYPIVKKVATSIGVKMTTAVFARGVGKIIPVLGAVTSGSITYAFFKLMSLRLGKYLATLPTANVNYYKESHSVDDIIEVDFSNINMDDIDDIKDTSNFDDIDKNDVNEDIIINEDDEIEENNGTNV